MIKTTYFPPVSQTRITGQFINWWNLIHFINIFLDSKLLFVWQFHSNVYLIFSVLTISWSTVFKNWMILAGHLWVTNMWSLYIDLVSRSRNPSITFRFFLVHCSSWCFPVHWNLLCGHFLLYRVVNCTDFAMGFFQVSAIYIKYLYCNLQNQFAYLLWIWTREGNYCNGKHRLTS